MRLLRRLWTDILAVLLVCLGLGLLVTCFQAVRSKYESDTLVKFVVCCLVVSTVGVLVGVIGRRRDRQVRQQREEDARRGYASKYLMPMGDRVATVIIRCVITLTILGLLSAAVIWFGTLFGRILTRQEEFLALCIAAGVSLGGTLVVGVLTWRRLAAQNRRLAEPLCPLCGYVLYGAERQRCPECGMLFDLDEVNTNLAYLDEQGRLQPKE